MATDKRNKPYAETVRRGDGDRSSCTHRISGEGKGHRACSLLRPGFALRRRDHRRGNYNQLVKTGLIERKRKSLTALGLSRPDLGPAYRAEYRMDYAPRVTLHQTIYPYAKDGPVTFTPRGQHLGQDYESFRRGVVRRAVGSAALPRRPWLPAPQPEARRHAADPRW
jgi:hypothetical protein